jgi:hypothetical protein
MVAHRAMSALPPKQTFVVRYVMSALGQKHAKPGRREPHIERRRGRLERAHIDDPLRICRRAGWLLRGTIRIIITQSLA